MTMPTVVWGGAAAALPAAATAASVAAGEVIFGPGVADLLGELVGSGPCRTPDYSTKLDRVRMNAVT